MGLKQKIIDILLDFYMFPINLVIHKMRTQHKIGFQTKIVKHIKDSEHYVSLSFMPIHTSNIAIGRQTDRDFSDTSIILQGPIIEKNKFTLETVELYKKYYKNVHVVVSSWSNTKEKTIKALKTVGADVIINDYPTVNGIGNMNYQLISSLNGVKRAKENSSKYTWKTRTDQRYYNPCALSCLLYTLKGKRLVMMGGIYNSFIKRIFHISDFMSFGTTDELLILYSQKLDNEDSSKTKYTHKNADNDACGFNHYMNEVKQSENGLMDIGTKYDNLAITCGNPETLLMYNYYRLTCKDKARKTLYEEYMRLLKERIGIVDADNLGFFWLKYEFDSIKQTYFDRMGKLDYARWCSLLF